MKKALLIIGIIIIVAGALALLLGILFKYVSTHTLDGSLSLYDKQRRMMFVHLIGGVVCLTVGILCVVLRHKF